MSPLPATPQPAFSPRQITLLGIMAGLALLAGIGWLLSPELASRWLRAMLVLPLMWLLLLLWHRRSLRSMRRRGADDEPGITRYTDAVLSLLTSAIGIKVVVLFALVIWLRFGIARFDLDVARRAMGLSTSLIIIFVGNTLPKILTPLSILPPELAQRVTMARRYVGHALVLIGIALAMAFLSVPLATAVMLERGSTALGLLIVLIAIIWMNVAGPVRQPR